MSDGITDSYRDQRRGECYGDFLKVLANFLEKPSTAEGCQAVKQAAERVDGVPRGLISGRTSLSGGLSVMVEKLREGDEKTWGTLLLSAVGSYPTAVFKKFKSISPFKGKVLISVDYGFGFVNIGGEFEHFLDHFIAGINGFKIYDADHYIVALDEYSFKKGAELVWRSCGVSGVKGPRKATDPSSHDSSDYDDLVVIL